MSLCQFDFSKKLFLLYQWYLWFFTHDFLPTIFCPRFSAHDFLSMIFYTRFSAHNFLPWFSVHDFLPTIFCPRFSAMFFCLWFSAHDFLLFLPTFSCPQFLNDSSWFQDLFSLPETWYEIIICLLNQLNTLKPHYNICSFTISTCVVMRCHCIIWNEILMHVPEGQFISIHPLEMNEVPQDHTYCFNNKHRAIGLVIISQQSLLWFSDLTTLLLSFPYSKIWICLKVKKSNSGVYLFHLVF